jgi:hypothetical protein
MFSKKKSRGRIDPVQSFTVARALALRMEQTKKRAIWAAVI